MRLGEKKGAKEWRRSCLRNSDAGSGVRTPLQSPRHTQSETKSTVWLASASASWGSRHFCHLIVHGAIGLAMLAGPNAAPRAKAERRSRTLEPLATQATKQGPGAQLRRANLGGATFQPRGLEHVSLPHLGNGRERTLWGYCVRWFRPLGLGLPWSQLSPMKREKGNEVRDRTRPPVSPAAQDLRARAHTLPASFLRTRGSALLEQAELHVRRVYPRDFRARPPASASDRAPPLSPPQIRCGCAASS